MKTWVAQTMGIVAIFLAALLVTSPLRGAEDQSGDATPQTAGAERDAASGESASQEMRLQVVDPDGEPVAGTEIGYSAQFEQGRELPTIHGWGDDRKPELSDSEGELIIDEDELAKLLRGWGTLYALHADRRLAGFLKLDEGDAGTDRQLVLSPACSVTGQVTSTELESLEKSLTSTGCYVRWNDSMSIVARSGDGTFQLLLPPGQYKLVGTGSPHVYPQTVDWTVAEDDQQPFQIDLAANRLAYLLGQPAPELTGIKGWKNGEPVSLADLRGKVVVLDFWGYWCGPCVYSMPKLMDLHDQYADKGLVIIGVHDDSVASIEELDERLEQSREQLWDGRDLPFLVALDGGGETPIEGSDRKARGATTATYGIQAWPTALLIDSEGTLVGPFNYRSEAGLEQLRDQLGITDQQAENDPPPADS